jgi:hypothetical protein
VKVTYNSEWDELIEKLDKLERRSPLIGSQIMNRAAHRMDDHIRDHLASQGRGGAQPPLTETTKHIYSIDGEPDGSGIRDHIRVKAGWEGNQYTAILGILDGKPTLVAKVQNDGCIIPVTQAMRGYFAARYGIFFGASKKYIVVPGRHFWDDSLEKTKNEAVQELKEFFKKVLV